MADTDYKLQLLLEAKDEISAKVAKIEWEIWWLQKTTEATQKTALNAMNSIKSTLKTLWITTLIYKATSSIMELWRQIEPIQNWFERLSESAWIASNEMLQAMRQASAWTVSDFHLMEQANKAYSLWVVSSVDEMTTLMEIARLKWQAMWRTMEEALWDIVVWLGRASPMILDNLWITINQAEAQAQYASEIWKTVEQLTAQEKKQALVNAVVSQWKKELEEAWAIPETFNDKISRLQASRENLGARIGVVVNEALWESLDWFDNFFSQIEEFINNHLDDIRYVADTIWDIISTSFDMISSVVSEIWWTISDVWESISNLINDVLWNAVNNSWEAMTAVEWGLSDFVYYFEQWMNVVAWTIEIVVSSFRAWISAISNMFTALVKSVVKKIEDMVNNVIKAWNRVSDKFWWEWFDTISLWVWSYSEIWWEAFDNTAESATNAWNKIEGAWNKMWNNMINTYSERAVQIRNASEWLSNSLSKAFWWMKFWWLGWGDNSSSWSWKGSNDTLKALQDEMKAYWKQTAQIKKDKQAMYKDLDKYANDWLKNQKKVIDDVNNEFQDKFDEIQDKIDDTQKNIDNLNNSISNLKQSLVDLKVDENKSIAKEVITARKELKALEEQYVWLAEVANSVSMEDLQWVWWVWKFDVDLIKKYKDYQDELASMYDWMTASEQMALDKEIEYAEWYDSLNWIEKIKEDYRIRQEEIQNELNSKLASLEQEQATLRQYKKEQQKLQDERIKRIDEEVKKYEDMYNKVQKFEEAYMQQLESDHYRQVQMTNQLIQQREAVYRAKMRAMSAWADWSRATWWPVYSWNSYLVWEAWPELFVPSTNWKIVKNSDLDSISSPINITIDMWWVVLNNGLDKDELLEDMENRLSRKLQLYKKWIYS